MQNTLLDDRRVPLYFTVPGQFVELPLTEDPEERVRRTYERVSASMPGATDAQRVHLTFMQEYLLAKLASEGAVYAALCLCRSEANPTKLSAAQFAIFVKTVEFSGERPLAAVAGGLKNPGQPRETAFVQFPAGEGLVVGEELMVTLPVTLAGRPQPSTHTMRQAEVMIPFPDMRRLAVLSMSSEFLEDWVYYAGMLNDIARSVSFTERDTSIAGRLSGLL